VAVLLVSAAGLAFRALLPADLAENTSSDVTTFHEPVARRLADGHGLTTPDGEPALRHPPGYPVLLAGAQTVSTAVGGSEDDASGAVAVLCAGAAGALLWLIGERAAGRRAAWVGVVAWALYPVQLWLAKQPNTELPYLVLLYGAVLVAIRAPLDRPVTWVRAAGVGGLVAAATLVRPAGLALIVPFVLLVWRWDATQPARVGAARAGTVAAAFLALLLPWSLWASQQAGHPVVVADAVGVNVVEGLSFGIDRADEADDLTAPAGVRQLAEASHAFEAGRPSDGEVWAHVGDQATEEPAAFSQLVLLKAVRSWYGSESGRWEAGAALLQAAVLAAVSAGGVLLWRSGRIGRRYTALVTALVAVAWLTTVAVHSLLRHMVPVLGLGFPLLAVAALAAADRLRSPS
jgi:hypothetical protein